MNVQEQALWKRDVASVREFLFFLGFVESFLFSSPTLGYTFMQLFTVPPLVPDRFIFVLRSVLGSLSR